MDAVITVINKLQDVFTIIGQPSAIDLPQIVVIGSQSSGKSSVLENVVGRDFLPRGSGIVTRRPLVLQLINVPKRPEDGKKDSKQPEEWGEFLHLPGKIFSDFGQICDEIIRDTDAKASGKGVSPLPINLKVYSPNVLNLTLVDLPGMTKVPVGDQPKDIEQQIRNMCIKYIEKKNAIILAVTAANTDLANSDGLNLARQVDPEGQRTIGVLTKIDIMDEGTNVLDILAGRVIPLRLGYVPVVNRGQKDIESKKMIQKALEFEKSFFENHPAYASKAQYCGTPFLARKLNMILMFHIRETLPELKLKIAQQLVKYRTELSEIGDAVESDGGELLSNLLLNIITDFSNDFRTILDGYNDNLSSAELSGGARISFVFHQIFAGGIREIDPFDTLSDSDIRTVLHNASGSSPALFVSTQSFEVLIRQQIRRLFDPSEQCVQMIYDELIRILNQLEQRKVFKRFPLLKDRFHEVVINFFRKAMEPTLKLVTDLVKAEECYINTAHPDFLNGHKALAAVSARLGYAGPSQAPALPIQAPNVPGQPGTAALPQPVVIPQPQQQPLQAQGENTGFFNSFFQKKTVGLKASGGLMKLEQPPATLKASGLLSEREKLETEVIKILLESYFNIVKRTTADMVPKAVMLHLVMYARDNIQRELLHELYKSRSYEELMKESDAIVQRRSECRKMIDALRRAEEAVANV